ncbi:MAG TPA: potassium-transporting ATPase subunit B, partial [Pseudoxanthomonas sp.]|nr:potassium-transporting ATPase subunit B [Pseudoxanthomonas sp.]
MTDASLSTASRGHRPALLDAAGFRAAVVASFSKLSPQHALCNPVMAVVWLGTVLCAGLTLAGKAPPALGWAVTALLFVTVLFANFAEAVA